MSTQVGEYQYSLPELEATLEATAEDRISSFRESNPEVWHFLIDPHHRESRRAAEQKRLEVARQARAPKEQPKKAAQSGRHYLTAADLPALSKWLAKSWGPKIGQEIRDKVSDLASASRVAELQERNRELEARILQLEKRVAAHDSRHDAHAKHFRGIETKIGPLVLAAKQEEGQP